MNGPDIRRRLDEELAEQESKEAALRLWRRTVAGLLLLLFGVHLLLEAVTGRGITFWPLAVGIVFLSLYARDRKGGQRIAGCILTGLGLGLILNDIVPGPLGDFLKSAAFAGGFLALYLTKPRLLWAICPAIVLGLGAVGSMFEGLADGLPGGVPDVLLPFAVVGAGALLVARPALSRSTFQVGIGVAIALALIAVAAGDDEPPRMANRDLRFLNRPLSAPRPAQPLNAAVPTTVAPATTTLANKVQLRALEGDTLVVDSTVVAIDVRTGEGPPKIDGPGVLVDDDGDEIVVRFARASGDAEIVVPPGTRLVVKSTSGAIEIAGRLALVEVTTVSGAVDVDVTTGANAPGIADAQVEIRTTSGAVDVTAPDSSALDLETMSGEIDVAGFREPPENSGDRIYAVAGEDGRVAVTTVSGDIEIQGESEAA